MGIGRPCFLKQDVLDAHLREKRAVPPGPAHALAALFLEHPDLRSACFAVNDGDDASVGDKRRTGENLSAVFLDDEHLFERQFSAWIASSSIQGRDATWRHLDLMPTCLNDCVHYRH